ncbi:hypothetical protein C3747_35g249 [Trypanosoma cruzi]|uniref:FYVE-type domain-containing protein n=1 Tax=Trypanosoma cruzi TaxID=5693 RepID=A0A2V2X2X0_TRYCR|nr:hypothetical protein C3747_35g249 [Trypanosoma cruzi]
MDHVDVAGTRDMGSAPSLTALQVIIPYGSNSNNNNNNNNNNFYSGGVCFTRCPSITANVTRSLNVSCGGDGSSFSNVWSLAKPTLDPSQIRFCPEGCWVPDAQVMTCMAHECNVSFSLFNRKHHCRLCGRLFCAACCSHVITIRSTRGGLSACCALSGAEGQETPTSLPAILGATDDNSAGGTSGNPNPSSLYPSQAQLVQQQQHSTSHLEPTATTTTHRICSACYYEIQLVVPRRDQNGEVRRRCRGELKMFQWSLLVKVLSYLSMHDLLEASLVSSDLYFISRDNVIWYQYNMAQRRQKEVQLRIPPRRQNSSLSLRRRFLQRQKEPPRAFGIEFGDVSSSDASKRVISLHARYNFTQFLDFARRQEMARCRGLSSFSVAARTLFSSPLKIAIIGSMGVGKTLLVRHFVVSHENGGSSGGRISPKLGFVRYAKMVHLTGSLAADVMLHIYDISGELRFEELRRFLCSNCHAVGLCYDPRRKFTLVEAADVMMGVEPALGPQPVVVCGILCPAEPARQDLHEAAGTQELEVTEVDASGITVRGRGSLQCAWDNSECLFQQLVQSLLDRLAMATATSSVVSAASTALLAGDEKEATVNCNIAQELLRITLDPSPLDVLMDSN